jgi:hypothetical protein
MRIQRRQPSEENPVRNFYVPNEEVDVRELYDRHIVPFLSHKSAVYVTEEKDVVLETELVRICFRDIHEDVSSQIQDLILDSWETSAAIEKLLEADRNNPEKTSSVLLEEIEWGIDSIPVPQVPQYYFEQLS